MPKHGRREGVSTLSEASLLVQLLNLRLQGLKLKGLLMSDSQAETSLWYKKYGVWPAASYILFRSTIIIRSSKPGFTVSVIYFFHASKELVSSPSVPPESSPDRVKSSSKRAHSRRTAAAQENP